MEKKRWIGKRDLWLLVILLAAGGIGMLILFLRPDTVDGEVEIAVSGTIVDTLPLSEDTRLVISGANDGENILVIEDGKAYMESASCPDGICVRHTPISKDGESIICLPNQVVVTVRGGEKRDVDAVA